MSKQTEKYMALASHYATLSDMRSRHGSVIVLHGSIIAWGYNHERNYSRDKLIGHPMSCHAEMSALRDAIRKLKLDPHKDRATFKRMHLYVARRSAQNGYLPHDKIPNPALIVMINSKRLVSRVSCILVRMNPFTR